MWVHCPRASNGLLPRRSNLVGYVRWDAQSDRFLLARQSFQQLSGRNPGCPLFRKSNLSERVALPSLCWPSIGPLQDGVKRRTKGLAPWCQTEFNLRRHLRIGLTQNDSVHCQAAELLPQHLLSDVRYRSFQVGEAHHLASE